MGLVDPYAKPVLRVSLRIKFCKTYFFLRIVRIPIPIKIDCRKVFIINGNGF